MVRKRMEKEQGGGYSLGEWHSPLTRVVNLQRRALKFNKEKVELSHGNDSDNKSDRRLSIQSSHSRRSSHYPDGEVGEIGRVRGPS